MSRVISLAAGLSLSRLFSTAAVADNGRGSGNSNIENQASLYTGTDRGQKQHTAGKGQNNHAGASSVRCRRICVTRIISAEMNESESLPAGELLWSNMPVLISGVLKMRYGNSSAELPFS